MPSGPADQPLRIIAGSQGDAGDARLEALPSLAAGPHFACEVHRTEDSIGMVVRGEFDVAAAAVFDDAAANARAARDHAIVVDLSRVTFIDSSGMRALLRLHVGVGTRLSLIPGPPRVQRVFELAGLTAALPFRD